MESTAVEKRSLAELMTLYSLEPELSDIYVEGPSDRILVNRYLKRYDKTINIVEINDIDFSELYEIKSELKSNCKNKVVELSNQLEDNFSDSLKAVICIADRDFDDFLNKIVTNSYLHYTDLSSIEMYFFNETSLNIFFKDILHDFPVTSRDIISQLQSILNHIFNIKLALLDVFGDAFEVNDFDFKKLTVINKENGEIDFNPSDYIFRYLNTKKLMAYKTAVDEQFAKQSKINADSIELKIRGHDFMYLFFLYIDKIKNHIKMSYETLERVALVCIDLDFIEGKNLFKTINQKMSAPNIL